MERVFFEEKQKLPAGVVWLVPAISLALCFPLVWGLYVRNILHEHWGKESFSNDELLFSLLMVIVVGGLVSWLVASISLEVKFDATGIYYRYFPNASVMQHVRKELISSYEVRKLTWGEAMQSRRARKFRKISQDKFFTLNGRMAIVMDVQGECYIIGTQDPEGMMWAMKKLMSK